MDPDNWYGFQFERNRILDFITINNISNVIILSGDRHWAGIFKLRRGTNLSQKKRNAFFVKETNIVKVTLFYL
jgi:phosphodiesterase/alkaline phosphatase D-like protein